VRPFQSVLRALPWVMAALLVVFIGGCGGGGGGGDGTGSTSSAPGTLGVSLTDMPACGFDEVNVTVTKVRVHQSSSASDADGGWTDITLNPARKINLLDLMNGVLDTLGETPLPAGHYTQLRLVLEPNTGSSLVNSVVPTGGVENALVTPSATQSGIKLVHEFDVAPGARVDLVLDFDACKSIVVRGKVIPFELNGINGYVDTALLGSNVVVTAQQNGVIMQTTAPNAQTGEFFLSRIAPGNYDVVFTADGRATAVIGGVPVASTTSIVMVSTSGAPITLQLPVIPGAPSTGTISGLVTLNPVSSTTTAHAAAKQTFVAVPMTPTVTIKSVAVDELASGAYTLSLPTLAPQYGQYSPTLPITLVTQSGLAGQYTAEASASGYQTQQFVKNISSANATQNFILVPVP
jgi:Domain of unknown function (DUF4382)